MANPEHIAILKQGVERWNKWREEHPEVRPDLGGAELGKVDFGGNKLSEADLSGADLSGANLSGSDLDGATLPWAHLFAADLTGASVREANLETHPGTRVFERKISVRGLASWWARSTNYVQAGSERAKSRLQASKRAIRRPFCDAAAASAGRAPAASACRLLCPLTKLRLATTAAITSCHRVFVFPK